MLRRSILLGAACLLAACKEPPPPTSSYFDEHIAPILELNCVMQTTGCHLADERGNAAGNLDLSSYDALMRRDDVLPPYGPYPVGLLLLKAGDDIPVRVDTFDPPDPAMPANRFVQVTTDVRHNAGGGISAGSADYAALKQWIDNGHTRTGVPPGVLSQTGEGCSHGAGTAPGFDPAAPPADAATYAQFTSDVQPVLRNRCAGAGCHASPIADFYLSCGESEEELRWNYFIAVSHVNDPVSASEILRRPLAVSRGGTFHEGGDVFAGIEDADYQAINGWATNLVASRPDLVRQEDASEGLRFFANRVQPVLVRKGCMFLNCHSAAMFHDLRLRGGSQGTFSRVATGRNYEASRLQLALQSPNPNDSRIVAKNLFPPDLVAGSRGIIHRGGSLFEDFGAGGATTADCMGVDADAGDLNTVPAYCVLARWHQIEREAAIARGEILAETEPIRSVVWVSRPVGVGSPLDFDTYRPGADLRSATATLAADGAITLGVSSSLLAGCGLSAGASDVRGPAASWDGNRIAFAARASAGAPLRLYWMNEDGSSCEPIPGAAAATDSESGVLTHDFDPAWAPDGRIVFASSRGGTRTPASMAPNANLYVYEPGAATPVRQLTFLLNQEVTPSFMADGRVLLTAEKRQQDFHQLAGRRVNLDGGDYHPLFAQRGSIGFASATEIVELPNRNLALVASALDAADGAGAIAFVNRSIGPDQSDRDPADRFYIHSMRIPAPGALGGLTGVYRSPAPLPGGRVLVSCDPGAASLTAGGYDFELCELDPATGAVRNVGGTPGAADVDAVAVVARPNFGVFVSRIDEANGHTRIDAGATDAQVLIHDVPLLATLLFQNTRTGRPIDARVGGLDVFASRPPPAGATTFADVAGSVMSDAYGMYFVQHDLLGHVPVYPDGSASFRFTGGTPIVLRVTDGDGNPLGFGEGAPFTGEMIQREEMQFYPGERANQSIPRRFFNGLCAGCHGSITGRELDVAVDIDALTGASLTLGRVSEPVTLGE